MLPALSRHPPVEGEELSGPRVRFPKAYIQRRSQHPTCKPPRYIGSALSHRLSLALRSMRSRCRSLVRLEERLRHSDLGPLRICGLRELQQAFEIGGCLLTISCLFG